MIPTLIVSILEVLVQEVGMPLILRWIAAKSPAEQVQAILDAEYAAARTAIDAQAKAELKP